MKLFTKTQLFFVGVIAEKAVLSVLLVTNVTRRADLAEAGQELEGEATILADSFNSWKRQIWISLIGITKDPRLGALLAASRGRPTQEALMGALKGFVFISKVDLLVVGDSRAHLLDLIPVTYNTFELADLRELSKARDNPYLELRLIHGVLCLVGITRVSVADGTPRNLFLVKRLDAEFCGQLTLNRKSQVGLYLGPRCLVGSFPPNLPAADLATEPVTGAYRQRFDQKVGSDRLNIAFQWAGTMAASPAADPGDQGELYLATFLPNAPYAQRSLQASRAVLLVFLAAALVTIILSLFLSRNITNPFAALLSGMERLKAGGLDTRVPPTDSAGGQTASASRRSRRWGYEIGRLFRGFDEMAVELAQDKQKMQQYIQETLVLKEYNEKIISSIKAGIAIVNGELVVEKANGTFLETFGLNGRAVTGVPLTWLDIDIVDEALVDKIIAVLHSGTASFSEVKRSGGGRVFEIKLYPFISPGSGSREASGCVFVAEDVSAKTELEQKMFQAEKLSSISMLSAGMAHEINNPLGSILTNVQNLIDEEENAARKVSLKWIEQETRRIARLVQELLNFASGDAEPGQGSDVNAVIRDVLRLLGYSLTGENRIRIDTRLSDGLPACVLSPDELKQVVINLVRNAVQAIPDAGRVLVSTRPLPESGRISLAVADTGSGISKEMVPRIFDPFFTTKPNGVGTGLGLSVVYGIVTKHAGTIGVRTREGGGTRITLGLPVLDGPGVPRGNGRPQPKEAPAETPQGEAGGVRGSVRE
jgi:nitrogen-specific signal transduction histidine kinase/HAMP domain-containing protein